MTIAQMLLPEFDGEMASTRRMLRVVPADAAQWRPHPKSYTLGQLATHIATIPLWGRVTMERPELDLGAPESAGFAPPEFTTTEALLERFDANVRGARAALESASDAAMAEAWTLRNAAVTVFSLPRAAVFRSFVLSHLIHHRGQLSVYLRMRDVRLPSVYGPTADER